MTRRKHGTVKADIRRLIEFDPTVTNSDIGRALGISRALVSYHTRRMDVRRKLAQPQCYGCRKQISKRRINGMCRECIRASYSYEYVCAQCGQVGVAEGRKATTRRQNMRTNPAKRDFCSRRCAGTYGARLYWGTRRLAQRMEGRV